MSYVRTSQLLLEDHVQVFYGIVSELLSGSGERQYV